jgi:ATP-binding cassette subfamily C protein CydC
MSAAEKQRAALEQMGRRSWRHATVLAFVALGCAVILGGLSAWFLAAVALAGLSTATALIFNFHVPGALVRLLALGRTAAKYGERLMGHRAALSDQVLRRAVLFHDMAGAPAVRSAGWQLGDQARLSDYLDDVEDLDFARLRVNLPAATIALGLTAGLLAIVIVAPLALLPLLLLLVLCAVAAERLGRVARLSLTGTRERDRAGSFALGAAAAAVVSLRAERVWERQRIYATAHFNQAEMETRNLRCAQAAFDALTGMIGPVAGASVIAAAWYAGARAEALLVPVFVAFAWLALSEALQATSRTIVAHMRQQLAADEMQRWTSTTAAPGPAVGVAPGSMVHESLQPRAPDGRPLGAPIAIEMHRRKPTIIVGPSGSGKTSLLKQIAGWLGDDVFETNDHLPLSASQRRVLCTYCPHDAAILADSVRANLFAPEAPDERIWAALEDVELDQRLKQGGGLDAWITQETLSLGEAQRLNLARALLSRRLIVILDEPTEHLDGEQAARITKRLLHRLDDRIVVIASHRSIDAPSANIIALDMARTPREPVCRHP